MFGPKGWIDRGLIHHWALNKTSGLTAPDRVGGADGTLTNMEETAWEDGQIGGALRFDGVDESVIMSDISGVSSVTNFTVAARVNFDIIPVGITGVICAKAGSFSSDHEFVLLYNATGGNDGFAFFIEGNSVETTINGDTAAAAGVWNHVIGVYDGANVHIYLNGSSDATPVARTAATPNTSIPLRIGSRNDGAGHLDGLIDDVRIYDRALSAAEVAGLATIGIA